MKFDYNRKLILQTFLVSNYSGHRWLPTPLSGLEKSVISHLVYPTQVETGSRSIGKFLPLSLPRSGGQCCDVKCQSSVPPLRLFIILCSSDFGMSTPLRLSWLATFGNPFTWTAWERQFSEIFNNSTRTNPNYSIAMQT